MQIYFLDDFLPPALPVQAQAFNAENYWLNLWWVNQDGCSIIILDVSILFNITNYIKIMLSSDCKLSTPKVGSANINIDFGTSGTTHKTIQYDNF